MVKDEFLRFRGLAQASQGRAKSSSKAIAMSWVEGSVGETAHAGCRESGSNRRRRGGQGHRSCVAVWLLVDCFQRLVSTSGGGGDDGFWGGLPDEGLGRLVVLVSEGSDRMLQVDEAVDRRHASVSFA